MSTNDAIEHFRQGREALVQKRREIDRAIADTDRILGVLQSEGAQPLELAPFDGGQVPTVRAAILEVLGDGEPQRVPSIITSVKRLGVVAEEASVRSILSKLKEERVIENPNRGYYQRKIAAA